MGDSPLFRVSIMMLLMCVVLLLVSSGSSRSSRIVGGETADETTPIIWQVYLEITGAESSGACGGVILSESYVITAAHCLRSLPDESVVNPANVIVCTGQDRTNCVDRVKADAIWIHPTYTRDFHYTNATDLAILRLRFPLTFQPRVTGPLALLPCDECELPGTTYIVSGYGLESSLGSLSDQLKFIQSGYVRLEECQAETVFAIPNFAFCAKGTAFASGACQGDSGGAAATFQNGQWVLAGIIFTGTDVRGGVLFCGLDSGDRSSFDLFVSVRSEFEWINASIYGEIGPPTETLPFEGGIKWYEWVPALVGGILAVILIIVLGYPM